MEAESWYVEDVVDARPFLIQFCRVEDALYIIDSCSLVASGMKIIAFNKYIMCIAHLPIIF